MSIREGDINDYETKCTGHSPNLSLFAYSNFATCQKDLVAVFILEFRPVILLQGMNMLLFLLFYINLFLTPEKSVCVPLEFKFSPSMIKVTEFLKCLTI